jgi:Protein of unknown function DUF2625
MPDVRSASELATVNEPAWPQLAHLINLAASQVTVLSVDDAAGLSALYRLQVTAGSPLGGIVMHCGGLLVDHGWLRVLAAGANEIPSVAEFNDLADPAERTSPPPFLVVAYDVLGGRFAVNGGGLRAELGDVCYFGPDTLQWMRIGGGYGQFLAWALGAGLDDFYKDLRWPSWRNEVEPLSPRQGISVYPFLFAAEGRDLEAASRSAVPMSELFELLEDLAAQADALPEGTAFRVETED